MAPASMSYSTSNGVIPEEVPELEADALSMNDEEQPASTFERGEERRPRRRGGRDASMEDYMREVAASLTSLQLSIQQAREEDLKWRAQQDAQWAQQVAWHAEQVAWQARWDTRWGQYMEEQRANWNANKQWQQEMKQRFSSWPNYPPPPPQ